jgi:tetratricopeptide (TPR) repeat protein
MTQRDQMGLPLAGASPKAAEAYRQALSLYAGMRGDPLTPLTEAVADSPGFVMAHVLTAHLMLVGANAQAVELGVQAYRKAAALSGGERLSGHVKALACMVEGDLAAAARVLEDISIAWPRDFVALQAGQLMDFLLGDSRMLRDRIARALPSWSDAIPDYHGVLGMLAFGLEECGFYDRAEAAGRRALELEPRNAWAQHAVAHVLEMQDRRADGIHFMRVESPKWQEPGFFNVHNWWHLALFHLGLGEVDEVLKLYDGPIYGVASDMDFDLVDASALLWRLKLQGVDLGGRWERLADVYESAGGLGHSAFTDAHALMAFIGSGRQAAAEAVLEAQRAAVVGGHDNALMARDVGLPLAEGLLAFGAGDYATAADRLRSVRNRAARFGGSHAQRDLIDQTLIASARLGGQEALARALLTERRNADPLTIGDEALLNYAA